MIRRLMSLPCLIGGRSRGHRECDGACLALALGPLGSFILALLRIAGQLPESRRLQSFQITFACRRLCQQMLGNFERRGRRTTVEAHVEKHFVQGAAKVAMVDGS